ncbi:xanthine dehydrogenase family protein molybdopterin-binding subunit [Maribius pontilimi]|uniref:Xanthine dehydrogenase family protein molybdopterin-binding subunit n=1 Tax=Palleronia pontilimi TaxID=1964209 RepID=A0A934IEN5_9RHOB|nr:xanthine dehydrogenase family protein molybdopterin-binding subunit [Palleronia pontilimi]MBJ3764241.1 xanthine dehydrogenase family protein molybdopterin-binding subunit [Palleronia pontilimi]
MTEHLKMDQVQPRLLDETEQGALHAPMPRPEGPLKVTGTATYAAEWKLDGMAEGFMVRAGITKGRFKVDASSVEDMPGFLGVYTDRMVRNSAQGTAGTNPVQPGDQVQYLGQPIAVAVADTFEQARDIALALKVEYTPDDDAHVVMDDSATYEDDDDALDQGDLDAAMADAAFSVDGMWTTKPHNSAAMEPHATLAQWDGDKLTVRSSLQMLNYNKHEIADSLGIDVKNVRVLSPYVGGGFGSKLGMSPECVAAAVAAKALGRPVRVVLHRNHVFETIVLRTETRQRVRLSCDAEGKLTGIGHENWQANLPDEGMAEPVDLATHLLYGGENRRYGQHVAMLNRPASGSVRAPGEAVGMLALENAMDELAEKVGIDPIELRVKNIPDRHPENGTPFSSHGLKACLEDGAERFGWSQRQAPKARREGEWYIGMGVASAARLNLLMESRARVTLNPDGTALVQTDMTDIGTGTYAILGQIAAEMLGIPAEKVTVELGDSDLPEGPGSGGSWGAASAGSAVFLGAKGIRKKLAERLGCGADELRLQDGVATGGNNRRPLAELMDGPISEEGHLEPGQTDDDFTQSGFGAHFAEVAVNAVTGEVRVRRMLAAMAAGRILNPKTAQSQVWGGQIWGIGTALTEGIEHDPRTGHVVNNDLAEYHVPVNLDVGDLDVMFIDERDDQANPMQVKGIGELGLSGAGAAITNAIYNACGVRVRDYPATPDRIFPHLD